MRDRIAIHRPLRQSARAAIVVACIGSLLAGCIVRVRQIAVENLPRNAAFSISTPVKAHLLDGSVVVFRGGARGNGNQLVGLGERYDIGLKPIGTVNSMSFDSVAGLESFRTGTDLFSSVLLTVPATALGSLAAAGLAIAIFGSCPTYYTADQTGEMALEAEGFSYSVVPIFEGRDVDALHGLPAAADSYELEVRNEALETHYINHMELIAVEHGADERVVPDPGGRPLVVRSGVTPAAAHDRDGRDIRALLAHQDGELFTSSARRVSRTSVTELEDWIDFDFGVAATDSAAIVLRLRNSLLSTVLLYDVMLADAGAQAVDWVGDRMQQIGAAAEVAKWYAKRMGLHVYVQEGDSWREIARVPDQGPIAWKQLAISVPAKRGMPLRVRVVFPIDGWRIDKVELAPARTPDAVDGIPPSTVVLEGSDQAAATLASLKAPDERYVITRPGQRFRVHFALPPMQPGRQRSYLIASQGYYIEWVRRAWMTRQSNGYFKPSDDALLKAMTRWTADKNALEQQFYSTMIPVQ
jgi:hypothetical protein